MYLKKVACKSVWILFLTFFFFKGSLIGFLPGFVTFPYFNELKVFPIWSNNNKKTFQQKYYFIFYTFFNIKIQTKQSLQWMIQSWTACIITHLLVSSSFWIFLWSSRFWALHAVILQQQTGGTQEWSCKSAEDEKQKVGQRRVFC